MGTGDLAEATEELSEKTRMWMWVFSTPAALSGTARCTSLVGPGCPLGPLMALLGYLISRKRAPQAAPVAENSTLCAHRRGIRELTTKPGGTHAVPLLRCGCAAPTELRWPCPAPTPLAQRTLAATSKGSAPVIYFICSNENFTSKPSWPPRTYRLHLRARHAVLFWCPKQ